jgi:hypothetical protein
MPTIRYDPERIKDTSAASAAYLFNLLPELMRATDDERYERLACHFEANIAAFIHGCRGWEAAIPEPSSN